MTIMNKLNVFKNPYCFYRTPFRWLKYFFRGFKLAYQRITKGYCDSDWYDLDFYYTGIISGTLRQLAANHYGYPHNMEPEEWTKILNTIADKIEASSLNYDDFNLPAHKEWWEHYSKKPKNDGEELKLWQDENDILSKKMAKEEQEHFIYQTKCKDEALDLLKKYWFDLWD